MSLPADEYVKVLGQVPILCVDGILINQRGQVLLVRRRNAPLQGQWWVPGGRVLKGESLEAAFKRKMKEELGIEVKILMPVGYYAAPRGEPASGVGGVVHSVSVVFCAVPLSLAVTLDDQSSEWGFFDELPAGLGGLRRFGLWLQAGVGG
jgi:colanic acid biosynthesis protein WcaH